MPLIAILNTPSGLHLKIGLMRAYTTGSQSACGTWQVLFLFAFQFYSVIMNSEHFFNKHDNKHDRRTGSTFDTGICRKQSVGGND